MKSATLSIRYSTHEDRLEIMDLSLRWGHLVPTAPDTLTTYPFVDHDPFVVRQVPHIFFAGNQPEFGSRLVTSGAWVMCLYTKTHTEVGRGRQDAACGGAEFCEHWLHGVGQSCDAPGTANVFSCLKCQCCNKQCPLHNTVQQNHMMALGDTVSFPHQIPGYRIVPRHPAVRPIKRATHAAISTRPSTCASVPQLADQWSTGIADCGDEGCTTIVPDDAFVLVGDEGDRVPICHADVGRILERGIAITGDRQLLVGSSQVKGVNCIIEGSGIAARHARLGTTPIMYSAISSTRITQSWCLESGTAQWVGSQCGAKPCWSVWVSFPSALAASSM